MFTDEIMNINMENTNIPYVGCITCKGCSGCKGCDGCDSLSKVDTPPSRQ